MVRVAHFFDSQCIFLL